MLMNLGSSPYRLLVGVCFDTTNLEEKNVSQDVLKHTV